MGKKECPTCGNEYVKLGSHLFQSECEYPELTLRQEEIVTGMMLGDGWLNYHNNTARPFFAVGMTNYEFLKWLNEELRPHSTGIKDATRGEWSKSDYYKVRTMRSPVFEPYLRWYPDGKYHPQQIDPTPLIIKMWYISDGGIRGKNWENPAIRFSNTLEVDRDEYFQSVFDPIGVEVSHDDGVGMGFKWRDSKRLFDYMGDAPPGFDYKWPDEHHYQNDQGVRN